MHQSIATVLQAVDSPISICERHRAHDEDLLAPGRSLKSTFPASSPKT
jgi:hypothetical protein